MGPHPGLDASTGWDTGYLPLAVKVVKDNADGRRELNNLKKVKQAMQQTPGPWHVARLEDAIPFFDEDLKQHNLYIAMRCVLGCSTSGHVGPHPCVICQH